MIDHHNERTAAALSYAARGWHVFPLLPGTKRPACPSHSAARCDRSDPFCRHGHQGWEQRATTSELRITRAWSRHPFGIGIACGPSRLLVIDTDRPKPGDDGPTAWRQRGTITGEEVLAELAHGRPLPDTYTVSTPSGGCHRYYRAPDHVQFANTAGRLGWLVDTRGQGGYVVAPPTQLVDGSRYATTAALAPAVLPRWLAAALSGPNADAAAPAPGRVDRPVPIGYAEAAVKAEVDSVRAAPAGQRNHALFCASLALGQLVAGGLLDEASTRHQLQHACVDHIGAGAFTTAEAVATITSGLHRGGLTPRTGPRNWSAA